jgi:hypothetical protein
MTVRRIRLFQCDLAFGLAFGRRIETCDTLPFILRSMKLKRRSLHTVWESGEPHLSIGVRSSFEIKSSHSTKAILDMNLHRRCVNALSVSAPNYKFDGARTRTTLDDGNVFVLRLSTDK